MRNTSTVTEFILVGFTGDISSRIALFIVLLCTYIITMVGNVLMIILICVDKHLHNPMYFFLWNLSLLETLNISNVVPLMLVQTLSLHTTISISNCLAQSFSYFSFVTMAFLLLPIMSYDRYIAICNPLRYTSIMNFRLCIHFVIGAWLGSCICILYPAILMSQLQFCSPNMINHFFCDSLAMLRLSCNNTVIIQFIILVSGLIVLLGSLGLTVTSYTFIILSVLRIPSTHGRQKAFSTCSAHLTMVTIVYGSAIFIEMSPALNPSVEVYKNVHIISTIISPLMNPFIYTFRNEKVKESLKNMLLSRNKF